MNGRVITSLRIVAVVAMTGALAACDTGDGKTLTPYDPADYPSQTVPPTSVVDTDLGLDGAGLGDGGAAAPGPTVLDPSDPVGSANAFSVFAPWAAGERIDERHTCDGADIAPAVSWGGVPAGTTEIAISLVDDSAVLDGQPFVHWVIAGIDPADISLIEGDVPEGAVQALNFFGDVAYGGPCPPDGEDDHLYRLTAHALGGSPSVRDGQPAVEFLEAVERVTIGTADLSGSYGR